MTKKKQWHMMKNVKLHWNTKQQFFTVRVIKHWHRWLREVMSSPSEQIFTLCLDRDLGNFLELPLPWAGDWTGWCPEVPFYQNYSVSLWISQDPCVTDSQENWHWTKLKVLQKHGKSLFEILSFIYIFLNTVNFNWHQQKSKSCL